MRFSRALLVAMGGFLAFGCASRSAVPTNPDIVGNWNEAEAIHREQLYTTCSGNLQALAKAGDLYSQDYDGVLPQASRWEPSLRPYLKSDAQLSCPVVLENGGKGGYAMNESLSGASMKTLLDPDKSVLFFEVDPRLGSVGDPGRDLLKNHRHGLATALVYVSGVVPPP